ncbi:MAG: putative DNA-binding domain-containing protein [Deltaproteobacteria bacterium]|nr:putative DNA-binding domain-containing protein [Deltaproteobacteria bacterium]
MRELAAIQELFYAAVTGRVPLEAARDLLVGPGRLAVYRRMYSDRLVDAIVADYPKLATVLGDAWNATVREYLAACPPCNPDIHDAGRGLAGHLARRGLTWHGDLAALEWARSEVFGAADSPPLQRDELLALAPDAFAAFELRLVSASTVIELGTNADDAWSAVEDGTPVPVVEGAPRTVAVWRRGWTTVVHRTLDADEAPCVTLLARGATFSQVCEALAAVPDAAERAIQLLLRWLDSELLARG